MDGKVTMGGTGLPEVSGGARGDGSWVFRAVPATLVSLVLVGGGALLLAAIVPINRVIEGNGVLEPLVVATVRASDGGVVSHILAHAGDTVTAGQVLVQLDPVELDAELLAIRIRLASQRLRHQQAQREAHLGERDVTTIRDRAEAEAMRANAELRATLASFEIQMPVDSFLATYRSGQHIQFDQAVAAIRQADAGVAEAEASEERVRLLALVAARERSSVQAIEAEMRELERKRGAVAILSPMDGVVLAPWRTEDLVGTVLAKGDPLVEIGGGNGWKVTTEIRPTDIHRVFVGMTTSIRIESLPPSSRPTFEGVLGRIAPSSAPVANAAGPRGYLVEVVLPSTAVDTSMATRLRYGYLARVQIVTAAEPLLTLLRDRLAASWTR